MAQIIIGAAFLLLAAAGGVISVLQFLERGFLFHNAWIWATKAQREKLDKQPHYRQSAVVFGLLSLVLLLVGLSILLDRWALMLLVIPLALTTLVYVIASEIKIQQNNRKNPNP